MDTPQINKNHYKAGVEGALNVFLTLAFLLSKIPCIIFSGKLRCVHQMTGGSCMTDSVWCLFSIENQYYQPDNNLEGVWLEKPDLEQLLWVLVGPGPEVISSELRECMKKVLAGKEARYYEMHYRLEEVTTGAPV